MSHKSLPGGVFGCCALLVGLTVVQMGCEAKSDRGIGVPEKTTPAPDPSTRIELGGGETGPQNSRSLEREG